MKRQPVGISCHFLPERYKSKIIFKLCNDLFELPKLCSVFPSGECGGRCDTSGNGQCGCVSRFCHSCCRQLTETSREASFILANDSSLPLGSMMAKLVPRESYINSCSQRRQRGLAGTREGGNFLSPTLGDLFLQPGRPRSSEIMYSCNHSFSQPKNNGSAFRNVSYGISHVSRNKEHLSTTLK